LHGLSAAEMIREKGEDYFRQTEAETLREMDLSMDCIVACGGGTPCFKENLDWMQAHGTCVFLDMPLSAIESRIRQGSGFDMRPLLADEDRPLILQLEEMWEKRSPFYRKIEWWKNGLDLNPETLAEEVILKLG
jgi:shikimate kinase